MKKVMLWWGRFDPDYSRNRIIRALLRENGIVIRDFRPRSSLFGTPQAILHDPGPADCIWVPCFRHRDFRSARRYADTNGIRLIFDPLISSWDKVVYEREKYPADHWRAGRLLSWERSLFSRADIVIADTAAHRDFYQNVLGSPADATLVVPVGAEEPLFTSQPPRALPETPEILFFGSFISLQGPQTIVEAAKMVPQARWTMLGDGPLRSACELSGSGVDNLRFEDWTAYEALPERIGRADIVLGIFGESQKAGRVIPNKVYQALACARPVITRDSAAYPDALKTLTPGISFVVPDDPSALAAAIEKMVSDPSAFERRQQNARCCYDNYFSEQVVDTALKQVLASLNAQCQSAAL